MPQFTKTENAFLLKSKMVPPMSAHVKTVLLGFVSLSAVVFALSMFEWQRRRKRNEDIVTGIATCQIAIDFLGFVSEFLHYRSRHKIFV